MTHAPSFETRPPEDFAAEIRELKMKDDGLLSLDGVGFTERQEELVTDLVEEKFADLPRAVRILRPLIEKLPESPVPKYLLYTANLAGNNHRKAMQLLGEIREQFPDFLPWRLSEAWRSTLEQEESPEYAAELLGGPELSIHAFVPDPDQLTEGLAEEFYSNAMLVLAKAGHPEQALAIFDALEARGLPPKPEFKQLIENLAELHRISAAIKALNEEIAQTTISDTPSNQSHQ